MNGAILNKIRIRWFKSIEDIEFDPGKVNVLIGANGSGKSNLLEAVGVLAAAAHGRVDYEALRWRGVRPGVPALYKCAFDDLKQSQYIHFGAWSSSASYEVNLYNPIKHPKPVWRYYSENLKKEGNKLFGRSPHTRERLNPEAGLIALKSVNLDAEDPALSFLNSLRDFAIYSPDTNTLRGAYDPQERVPLGLAGGRIGTAVKELLRSRKTDPSASRALKEALSLIDWAKGFKTVSASSSPVFPSEAPDQRALRFVDKYMKSDYNLISPNDASEGALYVLFHAVLAAHVDSPTVCAVDNADHALNPRLARALFKSICQWYLNSPRERQIFLTTQNPLTLDGLPLQSDDVRLFSVSRSERGRTTIKRIVLDEKLKEMADKGWTLSRLWVMGHLGGMPNV